MIPGKEPSIKRGLEILSSLSTERKQVSSEAFSEAFSGENYMN